MASPPELPSFEFSFCDLYPETVRELHEVLGQVAEGIDPDLLHGPLILVTHELAANGMQAMYRLAFYRFLVSELGLGEVDNAGWLQVFRMELAEHRAENLARVCRQRGLFVTVRGRLEPEGYRIEVENPGAPTREDLVRIRGVLCHRFGPEVFEELLSREEDPGRPAWETGVGLPLVIVTLRGLGIAPGNLRFTVGHGHTIASLLLPRSLFRFERATDLRILTPDEEAEVMTGLLGSGSWGLVRFDSTGTPTAFSDRFARRLVVDMHDPAALSDRIPKRFFKDLFSGPQSIRLTRRFDNYRIRVRGGSGEEVLFNVSGHLSAAGQVETLWQEVSLQGSGVLREGAIVDNLNIQRLIEPYIPPSVLEKARDAVSLGTNRLTDAVENRTILFADLEGFTHKAESLAPHLVMELLNQSLGVCVRAIETHRGIVDKFMGDAVMAVFPEPLQAVVAAVEIQNQFHQLNAFRRNAGEEPVNLRIGINTGQVILGNIGTAHRMDYTVIGDVVNTASRIEKQSVRGGVLVGEAVFERVRDNVTVSEVRNVRVKGKDVDLRLYAVASVTFLLEGESTTLELAGSVESDQKPAEFDSF